MGETTDAIRRDIDRERGQLEQNLEGIESRVRDTTSEVQDKVEEVQTKVKDATDWRTQFDRRPMVGLAVAFGGGVLLASMMGGGDRDQDRGPRGYYGASYQPRYQGYDGNGASGGADIGRQHVASTFDNVKGALMGVAAAQLKTILSDTLPGFDDEYKQVETEKGGTNSSSPSSNPSGSQPASASSGQDR